MMSSSSSKRPASYAYGPSPSSLLTPDPSPDFLSTTASTEHPSPLLLPNASLPSSTATPAPATAKGKSRSATAKSQRKINHSIIEKRRREKINACLAELREIVPAESSDGNGEGESKGEFKLEILVRTVDYVKELQRKIRRLESQPSISSSSTSSHPARGSARSRREHSPWQGVETESECGLSAGASDMSVDDAEMTAPVSASLPAYPHMHHLAQQQQHANHLRQLHQHQHQHQQEPAAPRLYSRQSAPSFVPIGLQRLPSIASMLPASSSSASASAPAHALAFPQRTHSSFSAFGTLPGAAGEYAPFKSETPSPFAPSPPRAGTGSAPAADGSKGSPDELRAAELLLAISSPELRGLGGAEDELLEDWSLEGRLAGV